MPTLPWALGTGHHPAHPAPKALSPDAPSHGRSWAAGAHPPRVLSRGNIWAPVKGKERHVSALLLCALEFPAESSSDAAAIFAPGP